MRQEPRQSPKSEKVTLSILATWILKSCGRHSPDQSKKMRWFLICRRPFREKLKKWCSKTGLPGVLRKNQQIIDEYNKGKDIQAVQKAFDDLSDFMKNNLTPETERAMREGLDEETLAIFDLLKKPELRAVAV